MKIENQILSDTGKVQGNKDVKSVGEAKRKKEAGAAATGDRVSVSASQGQISAIKSRLAEIPDVRVQTVERLRDAVEKGNYRPDAGDIAEAMVREAILYERGVT